MRIGELAQHTGISERMLRYYEQEGLLQPTRTAAGYRDYNEAEVLTARHIQLLSASGLKIETIRVLLPCMQGRNKPAFQPCPAVRETLRQEVAKLDQKLHSLSESRRIVAGFLDTLESR